MFSTFDTFCDHYIISSLFTQEFYLNMFQFDYMIEVSNYLLIPLYSSIKLFTISFDVIHSIGLYNLGVKLDAIPGRLNVLLNIRSLMKGEYRGFCYELCGQGHSAMIICGSLRGLVVTY